METLAFDGRMGASGDMLLGALVAAGADPDVLSPVADALDVSYRVDAVTRAGVTATKVTVVPGDGEARNPDGGHDYDDHGHDDHGHDDHETGHGRDDPDGHHDAGDHHDAGGHDGTDGGSHDAEGHGPHRSYPEVLAVVRGMDLPDGVAADAEAVFERLGRAEAAVHGTDLADTRFHEVGADDAIADVVGVALLLDDLDPDRVVTAPVAAGSGEVETSHGVYPVPPPAVAELAREADWALRGGPVEAELLTPTGAAILAEFADGVETLPPMRVTASGYGAGSMAFPDRPNVLRALAGEAEGALAREDVAVLETNLDDASPEVLGGLQESLAEAGARDVSIVPLTMKKSRPGHLVKVVARPEDAERVARRLAEETGTLGVRQAGAAHRWVADRRLVTASLLVDGRRHDVAVKLASDEDGEVFDVSAEYDDAAAVAAETGLPVRDVLRRAEAAAREGGALADVLVHVVEADRWAEFEDAGAYRHPSLDDDGFVHCSTSGQVLAVAEATFADADEPLLLVVDPDRLRATVKYEEQPAGAYPHVYGALDRDAIVDVLSLPREGGRFVLPERLRAGGE